MLPVWSAFCQICSISEQISEQMSAISHPSGNEKEHGGMSYQMSVVKDLSKEEATEMICEMADERGGKK